MSYEELKELIAQLAVSQKKTDEQLKKTDEQLKKTDEHLRQTDEQLRQTDKELRKMFKKVDERLDRVAKQLGGITNNRGDEVEEYFVNSLKDTLSIADMKFDYLLQNVELKSKKINDEFDILLVNGESVALIEVKYKVHPKVLDSLAKKVEHLKMLPQYKDYKVYAGVAGFVIPQDVIDEALSRGYFVLQRRGDVIHTYSPDLKAA